MLLQNVSKVGCQTFAVEVNTLSVVTYIYIYIYIYVNSMMTDAAAPVSTSIGSSARFAMTMTVIRTETIWMNRTVHRYQFHISPHLPLSVCDSATDSSVASYFWLLNDKIWQYAPLHTVVALCMLEWTVISLMYTTPKATASIGGCRWVVCPAGVGNCQHWVSPGGLQVQSVPASRCFCRLTSQTPPTNKSLNMPFNIASNL